MGTLGRRDGSNGHHCRLHRLHQCDGASRRVGMQMIYFKGSVVQLQRLVCVVVMRNGLTMHHHMLQFIGTLCHD